MFMNEYEIDHAATVLQGETGRYARYLRDYKDTINANSDGWPYWSAGWKAAVKLGGLVSTAMDVSNGRKPDSAMPSAEALAAACRPIKSLCTRRKLPQCTLAA